MSRIVDIFGNPITRSAEYHVFHDESEPDKRWLLIGLLFVQAHHLNDACSELQGFREIENYHGEIHFSALPKSFGGKWGAKARVAEAWLDNYQSSLNDRVFFSALAVDRQSPRYERKRFSKEFHAYNRFTAMALKAGITWHLGPRELDKLVIHFVSDDKYRTTRPDKGMIDNFEAYIPYRAGLDSFLSQSQGEHYPDVTLTLELCDSAQEDLLQFTDLLLGACQVALVARANRLTKRTLGEYVVRWYYDLKKPPWQQRFKLFRKFNFWGFPDENGRAYSNVPLKLHIDDGQLTLF